LGDLAPQAKRAATGEVPVMHATGQPERVLVANDAAIASVGHRQRVAVMAQRPQATVGQRERAAFAAESGSTGDPMRERVVPMHGGGTDVAAMRPCVAGRPQAQQAQCQQHNYRRGPCGFAFVLRGESAEHFS
jgi:hypothetical protein